MSQKSQSESRQYRQFRFEDSLRRYQPPPRKRVKLDDSQAKRRAYEQAMNNRLARLCETRKKYNATSRSKASEFSRKKEALLESNRKIQDENQSINHEPNSHFLSQEKQNMFSQSFQASPRANNSSNWKMQEELAKNKIPVTPLKLCPSEFDSELSGQEPLKSETGDQKKTQDIDFHIAMVDRLYERVLTEYKQIEGMKDEEDEIKQQSNEKVKVKQFEVQKEQFHKKQCEKCEQQDEIKIDGMEAQPNQIQNIKESIVLEQFKNLHIHSPSHKIEDSLPSSGRFFIKSEKGQMMLSSRLFQKLASRKDTPYKHLLNKHPYLSPSCKLLQKLKQQFN